MHWISAWLIRKLFNPVPPSPTIQPEDFPVMIVLYSPIAFVFSDKLSLNIGYNGGANMPDYDRILPLQTT